MVPITNEVTKLVVSHSYNKKKALTLQIAQQVSAQFLFCAGTENILDAVEITKKLGGDVYYAYNLQTEPQLTIFETGNFSIGVPIRTGPRWDMFHIMETIGMYLVYAVSVKDTPDVHTYPVDGLPQKKQKELEDMLRLKGMCFAFEFLMPEIIFRAQVVRIVEEKQENKVWLLTSIFNVSPYIINQRMKQLSLVK